MKNALGLLVGSAVVLGMLGAACGTASESASVEVDAGPPVLPLSQRYSLDDVAFYQAVKVPLLAQGKPVATRNAPVIAARAAMVRVGFVRATTYDGNVELRGELHVTNPGKPEKVLTETLRMTSAVWYDERLATTMNFALDAEDVTPSTTLSFSATSPETGEEVLAFPGDGSTVPLAATTDAASVKVRLVPISYESDGSGRLPDLVDTASYHDAIQRMYPVSKVDLTVREPFKWETDVQPDGTGWDKLLTAMMQLRRADKVEPDVYYVGVFNPEDTIRDFCGRSGCVLGIAPASDGSEVGLRVALVLGYKTSMSDGTLAQELAHAMGRLHAPCGQPAAIDRKFPYKDGSIGGFGLDVVTHEPKDPKTYSDFMSYCNPVWVSDYTFAAIHDRLTLVEKQTAAIATETPTTPGNQTPGSGIDLAGRLGRREAFSLYVAADGTTEPGPMIEMMDAPPVDDDTTTPVLLESAAGGVVARIEGRVRPLGQTGGRLVILPPSTSSEAIAKASRVRLATLGSRAPIASTALTSAAKLAR